MNKEVASVDDIRAHFPALERRHNGIPVAYFDGPGGTQVPRSVVDAISDYLFHHNANTHWSFPTSGETDEMIARSRQTVADFLNSGPDEIVFGQNMTTLTFHLARSLGRGFAQGDEIVVTELDHHANVDTWRSLEKDRGLIIKVLPMNIDTGQLMIERLPDLLSSKTRLVAIGAASNILGTITDVKTAVSIARNAGALTFVDAVHYAAHELVDVKEIGCDFLACSAYKFYGPHLGILYGRKELLDSIDFPKLKPSPNRSPERAETGTQNHEGIAGTAAAIDFLASLAGGANRRERLRNTFNETHRRQEILTRSLWNGLLSIRDVRLYGPPPGVQRTSTVSFTVKDIGTTLVARALTSDAIFVSDGDFYASTVVKRLGVPGLVRAGCGIYTTMEDVERLVEAVRSLSATR